MYFIRYVIFFSKFVAVSAWVCLVEECFVPALNSFGGARRRPVGALPRMPEARLQASMGRVLDMCFAVVSPHTCAPHIEMYRWRSLFW